MANQISTFAEFRTRIKLEAQQNDTSQDTNILNITNECLIELISNTDRLRDFAQQIVYDIADQNVLAIADYWANIEAVYYLRMGGFGQIEKRWDLAEQGGVAGPPPIAESYYPTSYVFSNLTATAAPDFEMRFYPLDAATPGDKIQIIGSGFKHITDDATIMPYVSAYPALIRMVLQRLQMVLNKDPQKIAVWTPAIQRATQGVAKGTKEQGNLENP